MSSDEPTRQHPDNPGQDPSQWTVAQPMPPGPAYPGSAYQAPAYPGPAHSAYGYMPPIQHPSAGTAMGLGLTGLIGGMLCGLPLLVSPFAWAIGAKAVREIDGEPGRWSGRESANAGKVMGIVGTVLLILGALAVAGLVTLAVMAPEVFEE